MRGSYSNNPDPGITTMEALTVLNIMFLLAGLIVGYLVGRLDTLCDLFRASTGRQAQVSSQPNYVNKAQAVRAREETALTQAAKISIDTGKVVGRIDTSAMAKTQPIQLGKTTETQDDIASSISKLSQLKGNSNG